MLYMSRITSIEQEHDNGVEYEQEEEGIENAQTTFYAVVDYV